MKQRKQDHNKDPDSEDRAWATHSSPRAGIVKTPALPVNALSLWFSRLERSSLSSALISVGVRKYVFLEGCFGAQTIMGFYGLFGKTILWKTY